MNAIPVKWTVQPIKWVGDNTYGHYENNGDPIHYTGHVVGWVVIDSKTYGVVQEGSSFVEIAIEELTFNNAFGGS